MRRRYRVLAMQYHPDRNPDNPEAAAHFRQVVEAFEAIQSARSREKAPGPRQPNYRSPRFTDKEHLFEEFFGISRAAPPCSSRRAPLSVTICRFPLPPPSGAWKR